MSEIETACKLIAAKYYGEDGLWLYAAFEAINSAFFEDQLPYPHIVLALTDHGRSPGWTRCQDRLGLPPLIIIHPWVFRNLERKAKPDRWGFPQNHLGRKFAFDVLVHECMHVYIYYCLGGCHGTSSHNNPEWISEVNRIAPMLGFESVQVGVSRLVRVKVPDSLTPSGRLATKVRRVTDGNIPFKVAANFPYELRLYQGTADDYYREARMPIAVDWPDGNDQRHNVRL